MDKRLKIGIVGWDTGPNSFGVTKAYLNHIEEYGDPVILCPSKGLNESIDMIVLPGGKDVTSSWYNQKPGYFNSDADQFKEYFVKQNLQQYIDKGIPVWGTCLGFQLLNVYFGGSMTQNINVASHGHSGDKRYELAHSLVFEEPYVGLEKALLSKKTIKYEQDEKHVLWVNSLHHQGIRRSQVADCMDVIAYSPDGYAEAFRHKELPIAGAQNHVEEDNTILSRFLFEELVNIAINDKSNKISKGEAVEEA